MSMAWVKPGPSYQDIRSCHCDKQPLTLSSFQQQRLFLAHATCTSWLVGALLHVSSPYGWRRYHFQYCQSPKQREKVLPRGLYIAIQYPHIARVTSTHNSSVRINQALPHRERAKKYSPSMCSAGA